MVRDEVLSALEHPGEIADAELVTVTKGECERQPSRVSKGPEWFREPLRRSFVDTRGTERLGSRQIETKEVTAVVPHSDILTKVDTCVGRRAQLIDHEPIMPLASEHDRLGAASPAGSG